jgi:uncharacterized protein YcbK (DUF882 family)
MQNWYKIATIQQEAGIRETISSALLAALLSILGTSANGSESQIPKEKIEQTAKNFGVNETELANALRNPQVVQSVKHNKNNQPSIAIPATKYFMGRDKQYSNEMNDNIKNNAANLMPKINALLKELGINSAEVRSGWRPSEINKKSGGAKHSLHMIGAALDISDPNQKISTAILKNPKILEKYGLWMENPKATPSWVHLDLGIGRDPKNRIFNK